MTLKKFRKKNNLIAGYGFLTPSITILLFIFGYQIIRLFWFSLVTWKGYSYTNYFNNFKYYESVFAQGLFLKPLGRSLLITIVVVPIVIFLTTYLVHNLYRKIPGWKFYRATIFISSIIPIIVTSITWSFLLRLDGPFNTLLKILHLDFLVVDWFGNSRFALFALCWIIIWRELGFSTIIFLAEISGADENLYEAALLDGANEFQLIRYITFPILQRIIKFYVVTMTIFVLNNLFGVVLVATNGGPGFTTTVLEYYIYYLTFRTGKIGLGSAVAVVLFIITFILILIYFRFTSKKKEGDILD